MNSSQAASGQRIVCVKLFSRGDLLLAAPAFRAIRASRPNASIALVVGSSCEDVALRLPYFDDVAVIDDRPIFVGGRVARARAALDLIRVLRGSRGPGSTDAPASEVFIFHRDWRYGALAWLAGIPVRRGIVGTGADRFLTHPHRPVAGEHDVFQYLGMAGLLDQRRDGSDDRPLRPMPATSLAGVWEFLVGERVAGVAVAAKYGFEVQDSGTRAVALGFGGGRNVKTRTDLKKWPLEKYLELAERIVGLGHTPVWLGDAEDAAELGGTPPGIVLAGRLTVAETASVLDACMATVSNDSLLLHLSEAVGTPSVGIFGPTDPAHYGPLGSRSSSVWIGETMPCSPCHRNGHLPACAFEQRCLRELPVESVLSKLLPLISEHVLALRTDRGVPRAG